MDIIHEALDVPPTVILKTESRIGSRHRTHSDRRDLTRSSIKLAGHLDRRGTVILVEEDTIGNTVAERSAKQSRVKNSKTKDEIRFRGFAKLETRLKPSALAGSNSKRLDRQLNLTAVIVEGVRGKDDSTKRFIGNYANTSASADFRVGKLSGAVLVEIVKILIDLRRIGVRKIEKSTTLDGSGNTRRIANWTSHLVLQL
jgi:hypothetical protein